jgi:hypothetical protein
MSVPHQKLIVTAIWCLAVADAARQGLSLPHSELVATAGSARPFNWAFAVFGLVGPPLCVFGNVVLFKVSPKMATFGTGVITRWVDSRWGAGSMHAFLRALRPTALVALAAFVLGSFGMLSSDRAGANPFAFEVASFFLAGGFGFSIARIIALRLLPDQPWV